MRKIISIIAALCVTLGTIVSAADFDQTLTIEKIEPVTLTPTGGMLHEEGIINNSGLRRSIRLLSSGMEQTFDEYFREQLINHTTTVNVAKFRIPVSEFVSKYFAFIFCNGDLPIRAGYTGGISFTENGVEYMQSINPIYVYDTKEECDSKYIELDALTTSLAEYASTGKTELEKALFLFDKISLDYYYTPGETFEKINYTPYSFLDNGHAICQGYAVLYKLALEKLGIESYICENYNPDINHAWNYIKIDGSWYHADPTWSYCSDTTDMVSKKYFLLSDTAMEEDGLHGVKSDWIAQRSSLAPIDCTDNTYVSGHLFNHLSSPFTRDEQSIIFTNKFNISETASLTLDFRTSDLIATDTIISEANNDYVYVFTLNNIDKLRLVIAAYEPGGRYRSGTLGGISDIAENSIIPIPVAYVTPSGVQTGDYLKFMALAADCITPIGNYTTVK